MNDLCIIAIAILSVARTARLVTHDPYPPMVWVRERWDRLVTGKWNELLHCPFCATPYMAVGMLAWMYLALPGSRFGDEWSSAWWWLVVNGVWGLSYVASIIVAYDQPD